MATSARAAVVRDYNQLAIEELPLPAIGPRDALLRVEMAGVCATDPAWFSGKVQLPELPLILGHEILGRIAVIGAEAATTYGLREGDRVVVEGSTRCDRCYYCLTGDYHLCDNRISYGSTVPTTRAPGLWGAYAEYMYLAPGSMVHRIAEHVSAEAGALVCAVLANGIRWLRDLGRLQMGESVLIQGVGPQGLAAVIAAKEAGAYPILATGVAGDASRLQLARELGADLAIDVEHDDLAARVREASGGYGMDLVIDLSGNPTAIAGALDHVRKRGRLVQAGVTGDKTLTPLVLDKLLFREAEIIGVFAHTVHAVRTAIRLVERGGYPFERIVTHRLPLEQAERALRLAARAEPGEDPIKVVLMP